METETQTCDWCTGPIFLTAVSIVTTTEGQILSDTVCVPCYMDFVQYTVGRKRTYERQKRLADLEERERKASEKLHNILDINSADPEKKE